MKTISVLLATPYGRFVEAVKSADPADPACFLNAEAAAFMAGIYDPEQRARFASEFGQVAINDSYLRSLGGHRVPHLPLPRPDISMAARHETVRDKVPVDDHRRLVLSAKDWAQRAEWLLSLIDLNLKREVGHELVAFAISNLNDGALELLEERQISCLEAAVFYSFSCHDAWTQAGNRWLAPFVDTWLKDWLQERPAIVEFAKLLKVCRPAAAAWLKR